MWGVRTRSKEDLRMSGQIRELISWLEEFLLRGIRIVTQ